MSRNGQPYLIAATLLILALAGGVVADAGSWNDAAWHNDAAGYRNAMVEAQESGKPVLVYFYAVWCGYCRQLNNELLSSPAVLDEMGDMVVIRVNAELGPEERSLAMSYGVRGYPALFVRSAGDVQALRRTVADGGRPRLKTPEEFAATLRAVR